MKRLLLILAAFSLTGCAAWEKMSDDERKAWIISGAIVVSAVVLADALDGDTVVVRQCFPTQSIETDCIGKF
jgi:uncharacterized lipoprotein YmbA